MRATVLLSGVNVYANTPFDAKFLNIIYPRNMTLQECVSDNVRILAAARGTSPSAIALEVGRSRQWIQSKLAGRNGWSLDDLEDVSAVLGVDTRVLMTTEWWPEELVRARRDSNPKPSDLRSLAVAA